MGLKVLKYIFICDNIRLNQQLKVNYMKDTSFSNPNAGYFNLLKFLNLVDISSMRLISRHWSYACEYLINACKLRYLVSNSNLEDIDAIASRSIKSIVVNCFGYSYYSVIHLAIVMCDFPMVKKLASHLKVHEILKQRSQKLQLGLGYLFPPVLSESTGSYLHARPTWPMHLIKRYFAANTTVNNDIDFFYSDIPYKHGELFVICKYRCDFLVDSEYPKIMYFDKFAVTKFIKDFFMDRVQNQYIYMRAMPADGYMDMGMNSGNRINGNYVVSQNTDTRVFPSIEFDGCFTNNQSSFFVGKSCSSVSAEEFNNKSSLSYKRLRDVASCNSQILLDHQRYKGVLGENENRIIEYFNSIK